MDEQTAPLCQPQADEAHHCHCDKVSRCLIYTHPSPRVQEALNALMDAMAEYDGATGSSSVLSFQTVHAEGVFTSITRRAA